MAEHDLKPLERAAHVASGEPERVAALNALAHGLRNSDPKRALALATEAWRLASGANDRAGMALSCHRRAYLKNVMGRYLDAIVNAQEALRLYRRVGDRAGEAMALRLIGAVYANLSQSAKAADYLGRSRAISAALGDQRQLLVAEISLGQIRLTRGEGESARRHFAAALAAARSQGEPELALSAQIGLGENELRFGDRALAERIHRQALRAARKFGSRRRESECLTNLGELQLMRSRPTAALPLFAGAREIAEAINGPLALINALFGEGLARLRTGDGPGARACFKRCRLLGRESRYPGGAILADLGEGEWLGAAGQRARGLALARRALAAARAADQHEYLLAAKALIGRLRKPENRGTARTPRRTGG